MMGMKKRVMRRGGGAMKKRVKKAGGGAMKKRVMREGGGAMKKRVKKAGGGMMKKRVMKAKGGSTKKKFPDLTGDGKVTKADILKGRGVKLARGGKIPEGHHRTKDGGTAKKGLYYYMNRAKKAGKSRAGKGTVTDKALKQSAKTAKK